MSSTTEAFARVIVRDPTSAEVAQFISTRSGAQIVQLVRSMREPAAQAALTAALLATPPAVVSRNAAPEKAKKALNAFVGFRCYYISIPVFKSFPMKMLSHPIGTIWEADPNKPIWALMAKAWSTIRDQIGKDNAPLDDFFRVVCAALHMPPQETYLELHGWTLTLDKDGVPSLSRDESFQPTSVAAAYARTPLSVEDIITIAQNDAYALAYRADPNAISPTFLGQALDQTADGRVLAHYFPAWGITAYIVLPKTAVEVPKIKASKRAVSEVAKKVPRPMNCWILFRDAMHKKLKSDRPELTVQQISTRCSDLWRGLSASEKEPWQAAAKSAKEEHLRLHPDYKYSPRRPGEKKKRQSRKAKRAAATAVGSDVFNLQLTADTGMLSQMQLPQYDFDFTVPATAEPFIEDTVYFNNTVDMMGSISQEESSVSYAHDAEALRHARLAEEFEAEVDSSLSLDVLDGDFIEFRANTDGNATLPAFSFDLF